MSSFVSRPSSATPNDCQNPTLALEFFGLPKEEGSVDPEWKIILPKNYLIEILYNSPQCFGLHISVVAKPGTNANFTVGHTFRHAHYPLISPFGDRPSHNHIYLFCMSNPTTIPKGNGQWSRQSCQWQLDCNSF